MKEVIGKLLQNLGRLRERAPVYFDFIDNSLVGLRRDFFNFCVQVAVHTFVSSSVAVLVTFVRFSLPDC